MKIYSKFIISILVLLKKVQNYPTAILPFVDKLLKEYSLDVKKY